MTLRLVFWMAVLLGKAFAGVVWQPVMDYGMAFTPERSGVAPQINPFEDFTQIGTDFGWMGPGQSRIDMAAGKLLVRADGQWTGAWHSLSGQEKEVWRTMDPMDVIGIGGPSDARPKLMAVTIDARGQGKVRLELTAGKNEIRWSQVVELVDGPVTRQRFSVDAAAVGRLKNFNWIVEPGSAVEIKSIGFEIERPEMAVDEWLFRVSLGKLRRCHDPAGGMTRDRAHSPPGRFDSVSATGLHALALATAAVEGVVNREMAETEVQRTIEVVLALPKAHGFLPHFVRRTPEGLGIHPGTEYSTVDTAIALQSMKLAAHILDLTDMSEQVAAAAQALDFDILTDEEGWIGHGFGDDGKTQLASKWRDWGGETALVLAQEAMVFGREPRGRMESGAMVFRGVAFIAELQSLLYPDFDREEADRVSGAVWPAVRRELLNRQENYLGKYWPESAAMKAGLFGYSAGEAGLPGAGYIANGVDVPGLRWIHPHAMVLMLGLNGGRLSEGAERLESAGFLYPMGLPENIEVDLKISNPMHGGLNAAFETLAAYHGWRRGTGKPDLIDQACLADPMMRRGAERFYQPR